MKKRRRPVLANLGTLGITVLGGYRTRADQGSDTAPSTRQINKLVASDGNPDDVCGGSVAVAADGSTAIIGAARAEDSKKEHGGAAYVFVREDSTWYQQATLPNYESNADYQFGYSVAISDDGSTVIIGANLDRGPNGPSTGSAYVFSRTDGSWSQQAKLTADDGDERDHFGRSVAMSSDGTTVLIGARHDAPPDTEFAGAVYVFSWTNGSWSQESKLTVGESDSVIVRSTSIAVADNGTTAIVGVSNDHVSRRGQGGAAYVFSKVDGSWQQKSELSPAGDDTKDGFGESVAMSSDGMTTIVGTRDHEIPGGTDDEVDRDDQYAYVFSRTDDTWRQQAILTPDDSNTREKFGESVAMSDDGESAIIGAFKQDTMNGESSGSAYLYSRTGKSWGQQEKFLPNDGAVDDLFGESVDMADSGRTVIIGAPQSDNFNGKYAGSAYVFQ